MPIDRALVLARFRRTRARTRALFALLDESAYYARPIALRNPIVFYEGHIPAFAVNTLIKRGLGRPGIDAELEAIFARGIDPDTEAAAVARGNPAWPSRQVVQDFVRAADARLEDAIENASLESDGNPLLRGAEALWTILEHEEMHQETLAYMWHELPYAMKRKPAHYVTAPPRLRAPGSGLRAETVVIPAGDATLGTPDAEGFGWDNERQAHTVHVGAFDIDTFKVTNAEYLAFMAATGAKAPHFWEPLGLGAAEGAGVGTWAWRGMFEPAPLPLDWPVYVTWTEADAFARWRGRRLPTEAEFQRAAFGAPERPERRYPWGDTLGGRAPANFDFVRWDPTPVDAHPNAASAFGVRELVGNGWEWTSTLFGPFDGFAALPSYPEYSADFFDGQHYVLKGASPVTARALVRRGFRNWFRPNYPYVYAGFRTVSVG